MDEAIAAMQRAIELNPTYAPAHWRLGLWLLDRDDTDAAERAFVRAREIEPHGRAGGARPGARVSAADGEPAARPTFSSARWPTTPGDRYAMQLLGTAYRRLGRADEAAFALAVGESGEPAWPRSVDRRDAAVPPRVRGPAQGRDAVLRRRPDGRGDGPAATAASARSRTTSRCSIISARSTSPRAGSTKASPMLEQVVARDPDRFEAHVNLASGYLKQNNLARARAAADRAIAINPTLGRAHETKGLILWRDGDEAGAVGAFNAALRWDPRNARALGLGGDGRDEPQQSSRRARALRSCDEDRPDTASTPGSASPTRRWRSASGIEPRRPCSMRAQLNPDSPDVKKAADAFAEPSPVNAEHGIASARPVETWALAVRSSAARTWLAARCGAAQTTGRRRGNGPAMVRRHRRRAPAFDFVHRSGHRDNVLPAGDHRRRRRAVRHGQRRRSSTCIWSRAATCLRHATSRTETACTGIAATAPTTT